MLLQFMANKYASNEMSVACQQFTKNKRPLQHWYKQKLCEIWNYGECKTRCEKERDELTVRELKKSQVREYVEVGLERTFHSHGSSSGDTRLSCTYNSGFRSFEHHQRSSTLSLSVESRSCWDRTSRDCLVITTNEILQNLVLITKLLLLSRAAWKCSNVILDRLPVMCLV